MFLFNPRNGLLQEMQAAEAAAWLNVHRDRLHYAARHRTKMKCGLYVFHHRPSRKEMNELYSAELFEGEYWCRFRDTSYYASNTGRIKRVSAAGDVFLRPSYSGKRAQVFFVFQRSGACV